MSYRATRRTPRLALSVPGRPRAWLRVLALVALVIGLLASLTPRVLLACERKRADVESMTLRCRIDEGPAWARRTRTVVLNEPWPIEVRTVDGLQHVTVDGVTLVISDLDAVALENLTRNTLEREAVHYDHPLGHAGGMILDVRLLLPTLALCALFFWLSLRRYRVVVDLDHDQLSATSFLFLQGKRFAVRHGDRVQLLETEGRAEMVLRHAGSETTIFEADARDEGLAYVAARLDTALTAE